MCLLVFMKESVCAEQFLCVKHALQYVNGRADEMTPLINFHFSHQIIRMHKIKTNVMNLKCNFDLLKCNKSKTICAMPVLIVSVNLSLGLQMDAITAT